MFFPDMYWDPDFWERYFNDNYVSPFPDREMNFIVALREFNRNNEPYTYNYHHIEEIVEHFDSKKIFLDLVFDIYDNLVIVWEEYYMQWMQVFHAGGFILATATIIIWLYILDIPVYYYRKRKYNKREIRTLALTTAKFSKKFILICSELACNSTVNSSDIKRFKNELKNILDDDVLVTFSRTDNLVFFSSLLSHEVIDSYAIRSESGFDGLDSSFNSLWPFRKRTIIEKWLFDNKKQVYKTFLVMEFSDFMYAIFSRYIAFSEIVERPWNIERYGSEEMEWYVQEVDIIEKLNSDLKPIILLYKKQHAKTKYQKKFCILTISNDRKTLFINGETPYYNNNNNIKF